MSAVKSHLLVMVGLWSTLAPGAPARRPANATGAELVADVVVFSGAVKLRDSEKKAFAVGDHMPVALSDVLLVPPEGFVVLRIRANDQVVRVDDDVELPVQQLAVLHAGAPGRSMTDQLEALLTTSEKTQLKERMMGWMSAPLAASTPGSLRREEERSEPRTSGGGAKEDALSAEPNSPAQLPRNKERKLQHAEPSAEQPPGAAREKALVEDQASERPAPRPAEQAQPRMEPPKPSARGQASQPPALEPRPAPPAPIQPSPPPPAPPSSPPPAASPSAQAPLAPPSENQVSTAAPPSGKRSKTAHDAQGGSTDGNGQAPSKLGAQACEAPRPDAELRACLAGQATALGFKGSALKLRYAFEENGELHLVLERGVPVPACAASWFAGRPSCAADRGTWRTLLVPLK
jgi:hypothetical protein